MKTDPWADVREKIGNERRFRSDNAWPDWATDIVRILSDADALLNGDIEIEVALDDPDPLAGGAGVGACASDYEGGSMNEDDWLVCETCGCRYKASNEQFADRVPRCPAERDATQLMIDRAEK